MQKMIASIAPRSILGMLVFYLSGCGYPITNPREIDLRQGDKGLGVLTHNNVLVTTRALQVYVEKDCYLYHPYRSLPSGTEVPPTTTIEKGAIFLVTRITQVSSQVKVYKKIYAVRQDDLKGKRFIIKNPVPDDLNEEDLERIGLRAMPSSPTH